jgi:hypothetical protein
MPMILPEKRDQKSPEFVQTPLMKSRGRMEEPQCAEANATERMVQSD